MEVTPPALGLAVTAVFAVVSYVALFAWGVDRIDRFQGLSWISRDELLAATFLSAIPIVTAIGYSFAGAIQMLKLRSYPFALAAAILAVIPWSAAWILGLPFGIWALVILAKPDVRAIFRENWQRAQEDQRRGGRIASFFRSFGGYFLPTFAGGKSQPQPVATYLDTKDHSAPDATPNKQEVNRDRVFEAKSKSQ
jgi:hypothetical protein